jgi:hypothetical protein
MMNVSAVDRMTQCILESRKEIRYGDENIHDRGSERRAEGRLHV